MDGSSWPCTGGGDQNHPQEKEMHKGKMPVWGCLTNSWEKKRSKRQRRKGKIHPSDAEFQRITRRDKKAFLSVQSKEIDENSRMQKIRDLFLKIRDSKGIFHVKRDSIKDINDMDLIEAEDIKKNWQEYPRSTVQKTKTKTKTSWPR